MEILKEIYLFSVNEPIRFIVCTVSILLVVTALLNINWVVIAGKELVEHKKMPLNNKQVRLTMVLVAIVAFFIAVMPYIAEFLDAEIFILLSAVTYICAGVFNIKPLLTVLLCLSNFRHWNLSNKTIRVLMVLFGVLLLVMYIFVVLKN